jgi:TonB family protein
MSEHGQSPIGLSTAIVIPEVLSEATGLDSLLAAILSDEPDPVATVRTAPAAVNITAEISNETEYERAPRPSVIELPDTDPAVGWLAEFPSEKPLAASEAVGSGDEGKTSSLADLDALRDRLQIQREQVSTREPLNDAPTLAANPRLRMDGSETNRRARPNLLVIEPLTDRSGSRAVSAQASRELHVIADDSPRPVDAHAVRRASTWIPLILVGVGVAVSSAFITLNAIPRGARPDEHPAAAGRLTDGGLPPASVAPSPLGDVAEDAAAATSLAAPSAPIAAAPLDKRRNVRATPSTSEGRRASTTPVPSSPAADRTVNAHSDDVSAAALQREIGLPAEPSPPQPEPQPEAARLERSAGSAALPPAPESVARAAGDSPVSPARSEKPQSERPSPATSTASRVAPRLIKGDAPEYPSVLRAARIGGVVEVQLTIDEAGRVTHAAAVSGPAPLRDAAERAVRAWRYEPATVNGVQTSATTTVSFRFDRK